MRRQRYIDKTHISITHISYMGIYTSHFIFIVWDNMQLVSFFENDMRIVTATLYIIYIYICLYLSIYAHLIITSKICYINFLYIYSRFWKLSLKAMLLFILIYLYYIMTRCIYLFKHSYLYLLMCCVCFAYMRHLFAINIDY